MHTSMSMQVKDNKIYAKNLQTEIQQNYQSFYDNIEQAYSNAEKRS